MIIYDKNLLENIFLVDEAETLQKADFIAKEQLQTISKELQVLKSQDNILIRLGFFLLGAFLYSSICGVLSVFGLAAIDNYLTVLVYIYAIIGFAGTEFLARQKYYGYGLDDAFLLGSQLTFAIAIGITTDGENILAITIAVTIVSSIMYLRYVHLSSALIFCLALAATLGYATFDLLELGKAILPFVMMAFAIGMYYISRTLLKNLAEPFYHKGIVIAKNFSLVLFYFSGNYLVVRELSASLSNNYSEISPEIPFALLFWCFTFIIPVLYLFFALRNKDRILLWIGFLSLCFSIFTFRTYHHVLPPEVALTIGGLIVFAIAYFAIKKTKHKETGITFKADRFANPNAFANVQTLVVASQFGLKPEVKAEESPMEFGGGGFSGGGSGGGF